MSRKKLPQVLATETVNRISAKQALNRVRHFAGEAAIAHRACNRLMQPNRTTKTEVVRILHAVADLQLFAFDSNVGDPVLSATVGAAGDVQFQVLLEAGKTIFEFFN